MRSGRAPGAAWAVAAVMVLSSCGGSSPSLEIPSSGTSPAVPGATTVYGTERLAWNQPGDASGLLFRAYVDGNPVSLDAATCDGATPEAQCTSPLPPMTDGVHTIAVAALYGSGLESVPSESMTVQKVSARSTVAAASFPDARVSANEPRPEAVAAVSGGLAFSVDIVARGLKGPVQLASTPDGRLLIADADARVRVVRPGEPESRDAALDARGLLQPPPAGGLGLAVHPDFARNHFVYVSFLVSDGPGRTSLRIVRLREVGDTLGEPATLFEAPVVVTSQPARIADDRGQSGAAGGPSDEGPRLAFGPDRLLYTLLPRGVEFDTEPAASRPIASMLRTADDGRVPDGGPWSGITAHPLGFAWHPVTADMWLIFPGADGQATVRPSTVEPVSGINDVGRGVLRMTEGVSPSSDVLAFQEAGAVELARAFPQGMTHESIGALRLVVPILSEGLLAGLSDRIIDMVPAGGGTLYLATHNAAQPGRGTADSGDVVVRLRPRPAVK